MSIKRLSKAFTSFRIGVRAWRDETVYEGLLEILKKNRGCVDDAMFFTSFSHSPQKLEMVEPYMELLKRRLEGLRKLGYRAGINNLCTIGHHPENAAGSLQGDQWDWMTDPAGQECRGSLCPASPKTLDYNRKLYELYMLSKPDFVWIDDDVRLAYHLPIIFGCFCDKCIERFSKETGRKFTRQSLATELDGGNVDEKIGIRRKWLEHNREILRNLFRVIEEVVHRDNPKLPIGFMSGDKDYEGNDGEGWVKILSGPQHGDVMWRPGGGNGGRIDEVFDKAHRIGMQTEILPEGVVSIQAEVENFPYMYLRKSNRMTVVETALDMASGTTGAAYNIFASDSGVLDEYIPLIEELTKHRGFYDLLAKYNGRCRPSGLYLPVGGDIYAAHSLFSGSWFSADPDKLTSPQVASMEFYHMGLPAAYGPQDGSVVLLNDSSVYLWDKAKIEKILSGAAYMDCRALKYLNELGYGELTGFSIGKEFENDTIEDFCGHELNGNVKSGYRDSRQSFTFCPSFELKPASGAQSLSKLLNYQGEVLADCCMGVFENKLGGRICVNGYMPWFWLGDYAKSVQLKNLMRWLSKDSLPGYVKSFVRAGLWVRKPQWCTLAAVIVNLSEDTLDELEVVLKVDGDLLTVYDMSCNETAVRSTADDNGYKTFGLNDIKPLDVKLLVQN